jgi:hypothetical protein
MPLSARKLTGNFFDNLYANFYVTGDKQVHYDDIDTWVSVFSEDTLSAILLSVTLERTALTSMIILTKHAPPNMAAGIISPLPSHISGNISSRGPSSANANFEPAKINPFWMLIATIVATNIN